MFDNLKSFFQKTPKALTDLCQKAFERFQGPSTSSAAAIAEQRTRDESTIASNPKAFRTSNKLLDYLFTKGKGIKNPLSSHGGFRMTRINDQSGASYLMLTLANGSMMKLETHRRGEISLAMRTLGTENGIEHYTRSSEVRLKVGKGDFARLYRAVQQSLNGDDTALLALVRGEKEAPSALGTFLEDDAKAYEAEPLHPDYLRLADPNATYVAPRTPVPSRMRPLKPATA